MTRSINDAGLAIIKKDEGLQLRAYRDVAGIPTIGYGHTPATMGDTISVQEANALLIGDVTHACQAVDGSTHDVPTTDNQFSAMVSLTFNIGVGAFRSSSLLRLHRASAYAAAANAFLSWDKTHVNGVLKIEPGLLRRRTEESTLYLLGVPT